jgi:hypothetical protein
LQHSGQIARRGLFWVLDVCRIFSLKPQIIRGNMETQIKTWERFLNQRDKAFRWACRVRKAFSCRSRICRSNLSYWKNSRVGLVFKSRFTARSTLVSSKKKTTKKPLRQHLRK